MYMKAERRFLPDLKSEIFCCRPDHSPRKSTMHDINQQEIFSASMTYSSGLDINFLGGCLNHNLIYRSISFLVHWYLKMDNLPVN